MAYVGLHATLGCAEAAAEGTGCAGGAIGGAVSALTANDIAKAVTNGQGVTDPAQLAMITAGTTLLSGTVAAALGQNAGGAVNAAANETLNNACAHGCGEDPNDTVKPVRLEPQMEGSEPDNIDPTTGVETVTETVGAGSLAAGLAGANPGAATSSTAGVFNTGANITPMSSANEYRFIGANGTFVTPMSSIESVVGPISPTATEVTISQTQATALENSLGLNPGSLESSNVLSIVNGVSSRAPRSPLSGNNFFLGGGQGLPGGGAELVIDSIPSAGGQGIRQITVKVK